MATIPITSKQQHKEKLFSEAIRERRATPSFDGSPVPREDLKKILDAGIHAPSGYNIQPWRFVVVQSPEQKQKLQAASFGQPKVREAGAIIVACGDFDAVGSAQFCRGVEMSEKHGFAPDQNGKRKKNGNGPLRGGPRDA